MQFQLLGLVRGIRHSVCGVQPRPEPYFVSLSCSRHAVNAKTHDCRSWWCVCSILSDHADHDHRGACTRTINTIQGTLSSDRSMPSQIEIHLMCGCRGVFAPWQLASFVILTAPFLRPWPCSSACLASPSSLPPRVQLLRGRGAPQLRSLWQSARARPAPPLRPTRPPRPRPRPRPPHHPSPHRAPPPCPCYRRPPCHCSYRHRHWHSCRRPERRRPWHL